MTEDSMLMCLIAFVLGFLVARMMRGNGFTYEVPSSPSCLSPVGTCIVGKECGGAGSGKTCQTMGRGARMCGCF